MQNVQVNELIMTIFLMIISVQDIKNRCIKKWGVGLLILSVVIYITLEDKYDIKVGLAGAAIGCVLIVVSIISKQAFGMGDSIVFLGMGVCIGFYKMLGVLLYSLMIAGIISAVLLVMRKVNKKTQIPFVPFITLGYMIMCLQPIIM